MLHGLILQITKFQLPTSKPFSTVDKKQKHHDPSPPTCQIWLTEQLLHVNCCCEGNKCFLFAVLFTKSYAEKYLKK